MIVIKSHMIILFVNLKQPLNTVPHLHIPSQPILMAPWVTKKYSAVLTSFQERFKDTKSSKKADIIKQVVMDITAIAEKDGVAIPPNLDKVVSPISYLHGYIPHLLIFPCRKLEYGSKTIARPKGRHVQRQHLMLD